MPRVTLYVPDDLKTRMDKAGEAINWSAVAQQAFLHAIVTHAVKKEPANMTNVIERLRASKQRVEVVDAEAGQICGERWAKQKAEYDELQRIAAFDDTETDGDVETLTRLLDPEHEMNHGDWAEFWGQHGDDKHSHGDALTDAFARGFITGATKVFREVDDQI